MLAVLLAIVLLRLASLARNASDGAETRTRLETIRLQNERLERELRTELANARAETTQNAKSARNELASNLAQFTQTLQNQLASIAGLQNESLATLTQSNEQRLEAVRATVESRLELLRTDNAQKLEQMRSTVDEKLQTTLDLRLGESFKMVSERREQGAPCWLPIDCKFPLEDYRRLQDAIDRADVGMVEQSRKALEDFFKVEARKIRDKYIVPPHTTDFAILFIPTESLYAEAVS